MRTTIQLGNIGRLIEGRHDNPHEILGQHLIEQEGRQALAVRAFDPQSSQMWVVDPAQPSIPRPMRRIHPAGLFEAICPVKENAPQHRYMLQSSGPGGQKTTSHDPYAFSASLTEYDLHLLNEGTHWHSYEKLGAHLRTIDGVDGVHFAVWAPNASSISVIGEFNGWNDRRHPLKKHIPSGFWEVFIPGLKEGTLYKFAVRTAQGETIEKCDPYGFGAEVPPRTASKVVNLEKYVWQDSAWMATRTKHNALDAPMSVYEVHLGSWRRPWDDGSRWKTYRELATELVDYIKQMGFTHVELMPVSEHPFTGSWGYQTVGYFAATSRYGEPDDLMYFIDQCHQNGIGVIIDWVPAHFPKDNHGLRQFDGTCLYEHEDPRKGEHRDWGTLIFNYGRHEVRNFLIANALFWLDKYHVDGLRVDAVASMIYLDYSRESGDWVPNEHGGRENLEALSFLRELNVQTHLQYPGTLTIAEESTAWPGVSRPTYTGGLGFSLKWNMGWMNDTLRYFRHEPIHRRYHHDELTFSLIYAFTENFTLPLSHDEVVHGKGSLLDQMPGDEWQRFANLRMLFAYMWMHPGKKLIFMGGEIGQWSEWNYENALQWDLLRWGPHQGVQRMMADLNHLYRSEPSLYQQDFDGRGFEWIDCHNYDECVLVFMRKAVDPSDYLIVCCNFTPVPRMNHRIGLSEPGLYREVFNSDSSFYHGSNLGNGNWFQAEETGWHGRPYSAQIVLPPLGISVFKPVRG